MHPTAYIDIETAPDSGRILDLGAIREDGGRLHETGPAALAAFIEGCDYLCGHNILAHDFPILRKALPTGTLDKFQVIDTLYLSALMFPKRPYHSLVKDDKLQTEALNNPLNDAMQARNLFHDAVAAFRQMDEPVQNMLSALLGRTIPFAGFFRYLDMQAEGSSSAEEIIAKVCADHICGNAPLAELARTQPIGLGYALVLILLGDRYSVTPPWVLRNFPETEHIMTLLRGRPCMDACRHCAAAFDPHAGLERFFGFDAFRSYEGEPLQEKAVRAAIEGRSLLSIFPTGGGKSLTFQLPALMAGAHSRGLTVVISPLQSLMKDQVDNLEAAGITDAVAINGLLDPIERAEALERTEGGRVSLLYISPESLRSRTIERLLLGRRIERFVIDEAHCFSAWGQDFRVDYLYIGDFIRRLQDQKGLSTHIPVSCFTATAKAQVIDDIQAYFAERLQLNLELIQSHAGRSNLHFRVLQKQDKNEKYTAVRQLLEGRTCPSIVYVSRTQTASDLAFHLRKDGISALPYHGKMEKEEKSQNQDAFKRDEVQVIVATSAFGMGVDKKDVGLVIHYDISDSLENYLQEAGRAGRDEALEADCYVLYHEDDLNKHFILLNQTKLTQKEINQVWRAIKGLTRFRSKVSHSALEIAREAGWDESIQEIETRVTTAIAALENSGYLRRGQNSPRIFASSILVNTADEAITRITASPHFDESEKTKAVRIIKKLIASKSRKGKSDEVAEARVDYISDHLGIVREEVIRIITLLREEGILADTKDLSASIKPGEGKTRSTQLLKSFGRLERFVLESFRDNHTSVDLKALNESALEAGIDDSSLKRLRTLLNFWSVKYRVKLKRMGRSAHKVELTLAQPLPQMEEHCELRLEQARFILDYLLEKIAVADAKPDNLFNQEEKGQVLFSVHELKEAFTSGRLQFGESLELRDVEDALFYLSRIGAMVIDGGFMVVYNALSLERLEQNAKKGYTLDDYATLDKHYKQKVEQIHIVGEYAKRMVDDYADALQFVEDYFRLQYSSFLRKYFANERAAEIRRTISPARFRKLFGSLSPTQLAIIKDRESLRMVVAAGPGSGKTRVLVHKLASLLLMEDVKHEQLLMLTFARSAATEFKLRLMELMGNAAHYVEIKTFHAFSFDLLGRVGSLEKSDQIVKQATEHIRSGESESGSITKTVLVIDEAQDMSAAEYDLVEALMEANPEMRVIAVGDDDQNIYAFRGSDSEYFASFVTKHGATSLELVENYRSARSIVALSNAFAANIGRRLKKTPTFAHRPEEGSIRYVVHSHPHHGSALAAELAGTDLTGSTAVLTHTNEQAYMMTGALRHLGVEARLIQSNEGFSLANLHEFRRFCKLVNPDGRCVQIGEDQWTEAELRLRHEFDRSKALPMVTEGLRQFAQTNGKYRYYSDLEAFIRESKPEDFRPRSSEGIVVSTMHKAKGKEWNRVYLLPERSDCTSNEEKRLLYVAMTRAEDALVIHSPGDILRHADFNHTDKEQCTREHAPPAELRIHLGHKDVQLGYFKYVQRRLYGLQSGDTLTPADEGLANANGERVLKFSNEFRKKLEAYTAQDYSLREAEVAYVVYWQGPDEDAREVLVVLAEVVLGRGKIGSGEARV